jgi:hypothetical protein
MAIDGKIGRCKDFLFDDRYWAIRYMVADTARWLPGRKVLISPLSLNSPDWVQQKLPVDLTQEQIKSSPPLEDHAPVSRQYEIEWFNYYQYPYYWHSDGLWGINYLVENEMSPPKKEKENAPSNYLRSAKEVKGYDIQAVDGSIGHVEDFIIEDTFWSIRYLVIDTKNWLPGRKVLISPRWVDAVSWKDQSVHVNQNMKRIEKSPEYDPSRPVNLEYEARLYDYYGRPVS